MARKDEAKRALKGKARPRSEIVAGVRGLHRIGAVDDAQLEKTTWPMLGRDALPKVDRFLPSEIAKLRQRADVSQAVLADFPNVAVNTVSQWDRGARKPAGAALKLRHVVKRNGIEALR